MLRLLLVQRRWLPLLLLLLLVSLSLPRSVYSFEPCCCCRCRCSESRARASPATLPATTGARCGTSLVVAVAVVAAAAAAVTQSHRAAVTVRQQTTAASFCPSSGSRSFQADSKTADLETTRRDERARSHRGQLSTTGMRSFVRAGRPVGRLARERPVSGD